MGREIFSPAFGNRPSYLVGRDQLLDRLLTGLSSTPGSRDRSVVMLGQRGSGKTVLLWELAELATKHGYVVAAPTVASEGMTERIVEKVQEAGERLIAPRPGARVSSGSFGALGFTVGLEFSREVQETKSFQFKLTQLVRRLNAHGHGILILIDELQANSPEVRQLVTVYQEMIGEGLDVALVLAGLPGAVSATLNDRVLTFLNRASKVELGPLATSDVQSFYERAFAELGVRIGGDRVRGLARATQGSPYLLQLLGYNISLRLPDGGDLTDEIMRNAICAAEDDFESDVCGTTLAALSGQDIAFLQAMARDNGSSRMSDIAGRMKQSPDYAQKYRKRLIDAGVISAAGHGYVTFAIPYMREHLRKMAFDL